MLFRRLVSFVLFCLLVQSLLGSRSLGAQTEPYLGDIIIMGSYHCPPGWAAADGQLLPIVSHSALFSVLGTRFGGDGRVTFGLPDYRGRVAIGTGSGSGFPPVASGDTGGQRFTRLTEEQLPPHAHVFDAEATRANRSEGQPLSFAPDPSGPAYSSQPPEVPLQSDSLAPNVGGWEYSNMAPSLGLTYCIALQGIYPTKQ